MYGAPKKASALGRYLSPAALGHFGGRLAGENTVGRFQPGGNRRPEGLAATVGEGIDLALAPLDDLAVRGDIAAGLELVQRGIHRPLRGAAAALCGSFYCLVDLVAMHRLVLETAEHEELRERHLDDAAPIAPVGLVHEIGRAHFSPPFTNPHLLFL